MQKFFFFLATLHSQKIVIEIAYISTGFQAPFKSAIFLVYLLIHRGEETIKVVNTLLIALFINFVYKLSKH